jgi:hypothetical protein
MNGALRPKVSPFSLSLIQAVLDVVCVWRSDYFIPRFHLMLRDPGGVTG